MGKHVAKRISKGHYIYRGLDIRGRYYPPEHRVCWEALEEEGYMAFAHSYSLKRTKALVDYELDKKSKL